MKEVGACYRAELRQADRSKENQSSEQTPEQRCLAVSVDRTNIPHNPARPEQTRRSRFVQVSAHLSWLLPGIQRMPQLTPRAPVSEWLSFQGVSEQNRYIL